MDPSSQHYLILDSGEVPLAKGDMESPPGAETIQVKVLEGKIDTVTAHEILNLIAMGDGPSMQCHLVRARGDRILLERISLLSQEVRRNLRIPVKFDTFLYPVSGDWKGRRAARSVDLSCGGIAFVGGNELEVGEVAEVVIPITSYNPLIPHFQVLRKKEMNDQRAIYGCKFVDMCHDEEKLVREAVFSVQLQNRPRPDDDTQEVSL